MTQTGGDFRCDGCGVSVENGSLNNCIVINRIVPPGNVENLHLCLDREIDGKKKKGCSNRVLSKTALKNYHSEKEDD